MISIITAVHNQIEFNKLFLQSLHRNSVLPHEIIIVDNHSTDGSAELFEREGCKVIRNAENHCYPESQNIGMVHATYEYLVFLNNDIYLAPEWDRHLIEAMTSHELDIASLSSFQALEDPRERRKYHHRWKYARKGKRFLSAGLPELLDMMERMYRGSFENWARVQYERHYPRVYTGINGSAVATTRSVWDKLGGNWDERIQAADWDLFIKASKRADEVGDMKPPMIVPWAQHHHFAGITVRNQPEPLRCKHPHLTLQEKWGEEEISQHDPQHPRDTSLLGRFRAAVKYVGVMVSPRKRKKRQQGTTGY